MCSVDIIHDIIPPPPQRRQYRELAARITTIVSDYANRNAIDFLRGIAHNLSFWDNMIIHRHVETLWCIKKYVNNNYYFKYCLLFNKQLFDMVFFKLLKKTGGIWPGGLLACVHYIRFTYVVSIKHHVHFHFLEIVYVNCSVFKWKINPYNTEFFLFKPWSLKGIFQLEIIINILVFSVHLNTYVMGLRPLHIFMFFQCGDRLYTS